MYADESGLLVFGAPLTSARLSKNKFFDSLRDRCEIHLSRIFYVLKIFWSAGSAPG